MMKQGKRLTLLSVRLSVGMGALLLGSGLLMNAAQAQEAAPTPLQKQLALVDLGVSAFGEFTSSASGNTKLNQPLSLSPSKTLGTLVTLRYTKSPFIGFEANYNFARYTEDFIYTNQANNSATQIPLGVQVNATEYSGGYVIHPRQIYGLQPYASIGAGVTAFRPTQHGGQGFSPQARATYYYSVGVEDMLYRERLGVRVGFRQAYFLAPDFQTNYLTNKQRVLESEPTIGLFLKF